MKTVVLQRITFLVNFAVVFGQRVALKTNACGGSGVCNCFDENIMYVVNCSHQNFDEVPLMIPRNVSHLLLSHNRLRELPEGIFDKMLELQILDLSNNYLRELPPRLFENNRMLSNLSLCRNNLTEIPEDLFTPAEDLKFLLLSHNYLRELPEGIFDDMLELETLDLSYNNLKELSARIFKHNRMLSNLRLSHNQLKELPQDLLEHNSNLTKLTLCRNDLTEIPEDLFTSVEDLHVLTLCSNNFTSISKTALNGLTTLQLLLLSHNYLRELPEGIFDAILELETLDLSYNNLKQLPARIFKHNRMLSNLRLSNNQLKELPQDIFEQNTNLTGLELAGNQLRKIPSNLLKTTVQLQYLSLCRNNLTEIPENLFSSVKNLKFLSLCRNNLNSINKTALNGPTDLQLLDLKANKLSSLPKDLFSGVNLSKALDLSDNNVKEIPDGLFCSNKLRYHNLKWLLIRNNKLEYLNQTCFEGLYNLTHIFLNGNSIEELGDNVFANTSIQYIYIFSNQMTEISSTSFNTTSLREIQIYKNPIKNISAEAFDTKWKPIRIYLHCYDLHTIPSLSSDVKVTCITGESVPKIAIPTTTTAEQFRIHLEQDGFNCSFHERKPECTPCPPGTYEDGTNKCRRCPAGGYFQDDFGLTECNVCNEGTFVNRSGGNSVQDCELCPEGTNLTRHAGHRACFCKMNYARVHRFQACSLCLEEGLNCSRDYKSLQPGYYWNWSFPGANLTAYSKFVRHLENDSLNYDTPSKQYRHQIPKVHRCPLRDSCENIGSYKAENITGNCKHGYRGWLCSKCQNNFYSILHTCIKCPDKTWITLETIGILSLVIGLYVFMTRQNKGNGKYDKNERSLMDKVSSQMKIVLGFYQVIGELCESFKDIPWIGPLKFLEQLIFFLKFNVFRVFFLPRCYSDKLKINVKIQFILSLSFPFVIFFLFTSFYHTWKLYLRYKFRNAIIKPFKKLRKLREKLYTYTLILLFITYPPTCDVIFKLYPDACKTFYIYENDTTVNTTLLRSDFDLDCESLKTYQVFSFIATVVYVASFPCILLMILKTYRKKIVSTKSDGEQFSDYQYDPGTSTNDEAHLVHGTCENIGIPVWIKFLCENYKPQYWYWEIIELARKVTQTILVTLLGWEDALTKLLTIGISVLFLTLHARLSPMTSAFEQRLQMFSLSAIFINVLIAAVPIPRTYRAPLATILILMNMIIIVVISGEIALFIFRAVKGKMTRKEKE